MPNWTRYLFDLGDLTVQYNYLNASDLEPNIEKMRRNPTRYSPQLIRLGKDYVREVARV